MDLGRLPDERPERLTVVFDGYCGMCTRSAALLMRWDRRNALDVVASQAHGVLERTALTEAQTTAAAWSVTPDGAAVGGARAIALAVAVGRGWRWPLWPWKLPALPWLLDRIYAFVADHRRWFPGAQPWCEQHPDRCVEGAASCAVPTGEDQPATTSSEPGSDR